MSSKSPREAFFARFSRNAMEAVASSESPFSEIPPPLILLTGGLRTPAHLHTALASRHADLLGIGRCSITCPHLPDALREMDVAEGEQLCKSYIPFAPEPDFTRGPLGTDSWVGSWISTVFSRIQLVGAGSRMAWYIAMIHRIAISPQRRHVQMDYDMSATVAVIRMWVRPDWNIMIVVAIGVGCIVLASCCMLVSRV